MTWTLGCDSIAPSSSGGQYMPAEGPSGMGSCITRQGSTSAARRHVPLAKRFRVPWVSDHCFYSDASWSDVWSSPLQFSRAEVLRVLVPPFLA